MGHGRPRGSGDQTESGGLDPPVQSRRLLHVRDTHAVIEFKFTGMHQYGVSWRKNMLVPKYSLV